MTYSELFEENYGNGEVSSRYVLKILKEHNILKEDYEDFISQFGKKDYYQLNADFQSWLGY